MTGSIGWQVYNDNLGSRYAILTDESNVRISTFTFGGGLVNRYTLPQAPFPSRAPRGFKPRVVTTVNTDDARLRRRFIVTTIELFNVIIVTPEIFIVTGSGAVQADYWSVLRTVHEQYPLRANFFVDTGLIDGTPSTR